MFSYFTLETLAKWDPTHFVAIAMPSVSYNICAAASGGREIFMEELKKVSGKYLEYKGKPPVREGDTICYGDKTDKCFLILEIMSYKKEGENEIPDKIFIQVVDSNNPSKIIKQGEKSGLYDAFGIGVIWLEMANK